jgi:hypothetical protein
LAIAGALVIVSLVIPRGSFAAEPPHTRPVPPMQAVPQPYGQVSFQREGV